MVEINECAWQRFRKDIEGVTGEEADWRPVPEANSINLVLRHVLIDALWHVAAVEGSGEAPPSALPEEPPPLDFERNLEDLDASWARFIAGLRALTQPALKKRTLAAYQGAPQGPAPEHLLGFHFALHLTAHDGQIRALRNLYRRTRGETARFFPDNPTFPT